MSYEENQSNHLNIGPLVQALVKQKGLTEAPTWNIYKVNELARQINADKVIFEPEDIILQSNLIQTRNKEIGKIQIIFDRTEVYENRQYMKFRVKLKGAKRESSISIALDENLMYVDYFLYFRDTFKGTGLGHFMMAFLKDLAYQLKKIDHIKLNSVDDAIEFYEKEGFVLNDSDGYHYFYL